MNTLAWIAILAGMLIVRGVVKGRVTELPRDMSDMLLAALQGDFDAIKEINARTGEGLATPELAPLTGAVTSTTTNPTDSSEGTELLAEVRRLGKGKPYVWGGTFSGNGGGDCSGLVWRALKNNGIYTGIRFTTFTFDAASKSFAHRVTTIQAGDIVLWTKHMGVASGPNTLYSAISSEYGVRDAPMSWFRKNGTPRIYRLGKK